MGLTGRRIDIEGTVQGVGFRPWVYRLAREVGIGGRVRNGPAGVTIEAFGESGAVDHFVTLLGERPPAQATIVRLVTSAIPAEDTRGFSIVQSALSGARVLSIPPDLATCAECEAEIRDPQQRRHRYAFTNCTNCGPRYTIASGVPYDRPATTMSGFLMCPDCRAEYDNPEDRRFHAQPIACPVCGPRLWLVDARGAGVGNGDPIEGAAAAIRAGRIVAVKGLGGFHLACDARSSDAVSSLRLRKRRDSKPFAVMVSDVGAAREVAALDDAEIALLSSPIRPIVIAKRREGSALAPEIAPLTDAVGVMLPYAPLHWLLLDAVGGPIVLTSGNLAQEPIACANDEALARLGTLADRFLLHDRPIAGRCDDSVTRVIDGAPLVLRRSRGYVPTPIRLARPVARPILACGAHLKNTFCLVERDRAYLGPHVGDLDTLEAYAFLGEAVARFQTLLGITPEIVAHDMHPDYLSTRFARERPEPRKIAVQHHHAHVASAMAERGLDGEVFGVAYDGTGYGTDGAAWGGEVLLASYGGFRRIATFRPIALAGGDRAIVEVWRIALAALDDAFDGDPPLDRLSLFGAVDAKRIEQVRQLIRLGVNAFPAHGVGRYFDVFGALLFARTTAAYEGQLATAVEAAADAGARPYPFFVDCTTDPFLVDLRPAIRRFVADLIAGRDRSAMAGSLHATITAATTDVLDAASGVYGKRPVVLTGGCFQNALLAGETTRTLSDRFTVYRHGMVPPGDGGIALGQALVADAIAAERGGACV